MRERIKSLVSKLKILKRDMWRLHGNEGKSRKSVIYSIARVISITLSGLKENRILARAAALSFSSLLGLGPMIALAVLISGFVLDQSEPGMAQDTIERIVSYIAPQVALQVPSEDGEETDEVGEMISQFIQASQSGTVGIGGTIILMVIVIQLFMSIEDAFNDIWGVAKGRSLASKIVLYWTVITLGTITIFAGLAIAVSELMQLNTRLSEFTEGIPGSETVTSWIATYGRMLGNVVLVSALLSFFYRFIPNTRVEWKAAFVGALFTVTCFVINNSFAFFYIERVALQRTLYGSLALPIILMIGLFTFWLCLLLGGKLSFAVQNARYKSGRVVWDELSLASQESLCLMLLAQIGRRFQDCEKPLSTLELANTNNLPLALTEAALGHLSDLGLASTIPVKDKEISKEHCYQPARPLEKIGLLEFRERFESHGESPDEQFFESRDPLVGTYHHLLNQARSQSIGTLTLAEAIEQQKQSK